MRRIIALISLLALAITMLTGCTNPIYSRNINNTYSKLRVGMTKAEINKLFSGYKFLRQQEVRAYEKIGEAESRMLLKQNKVYDDISSRDMFNSIRMDGSVKLLAYLEKKVLNWPNGTITYYIAIFYDSKTDKVIGWAKLGTYLRLDLWSDRF